MQQPPPSHAILLCSFAPERGFPIVYANEAAHALFALAAPQLSRSSLADLLEPYEEWERYATTLLEHGHLVSETGIVRLRNQSTPLRLDGHVISEYDPPAVLLTLSSVSLESEVSSFEDSGTQSLLDNFPFCYIEVDHNWRILAASRGCGEFFQCSAQSLHGKSLAAIWPGFEGGLLEEKLRQACSESSSLQCEAVFESEPRSFTEWHVRTQSDRLCISFRDITAQKKLEESAARGEKGFFAFFNSISDVMLVEDADHQILATNAAFSKVFGYTTEEGVGKSSYDLFDSRVDFERVQRAIARTVAPDGSPPIEVRCRRKDGTVFWSECSGFHALQAENEPFRKITIHRDVTHRKQVQKALLSSEARFREMADTAPAMIWTSDASGACTFLSRAWYEYTGVEPGSGLGFHWLEALHPEDRAQVSPESLRRTVAQTSFSHEYRLRRREGDYGWVLDSGRPKFSETGVFQGYVGSIIDISDRKLAEKAVQRSWKLLEAVVEASPLATTVLDVEGRIHFWNSAATRIFGWERDEVLGHVTPTVQPEKREEFLAYLRKTLAGECLDRYEVQRPCKDGSLVHLALWSAPLHDEFGEENRIIAFGEDIGDQRRAQAALRESEERFRTLADNIAQFAWMADPTGYITWYNQRWFDYTGTTFAEMEGWGWRKVHHPDHVQRVEREFRKCIEAGVPWEDTFPLRGKDGRFGWFLSRALPIRDSTGAILRWFGTNTDITAQREIEDALRESQERLKSALQTSSSGAFEWDMATGDQWWSDEMFDLWGFERTDNHIHSGETETRIFPEDRERITGELTQAVQRRDREWRAEFRIAHPKRGVRWLLVMGQALYNQSGDPLKLTGISLDITSRRETEEMLRASQERLSLALRTSGSGVYDWDLRNNTQWWSPEMYDLWEEPRQDGLRRSDASNHRIQQEDLLRMQKTFMDAMRRGETEWREEFRVNLPTRGTRWFSALGHAFFDESRTPVRIVGTNQDITEQKEFQKRLQEWNDTLEERVLERTAEVQHLADQLRALASELTQVEQRERKRLAAILHDHIQQLLVAAVMQLERIARTPQASPASIQNVAAIVREAIAESRSLTVALSPPVLHEAGLAGGLKWLAAHMLDHNQLTVSLRLDPDAEPALEDIRSLLFECVRELLFNVVKHAGVSDASVETKRLPENRIRITVRDQGKGFEPRSLRAEGATSGSFGLFSIQQRLAHSGGEVAINAAPGAGVEVTIEAPLGHPAEPEEVAQPPARPVYHPTKPPKPRSKKISILLVDDHKILPDGLAGLIAAEEDLEIVGQASNGEQAIAMAEQLHPDIVIMDVSMHGINGIEATRVLTRSLPNVKVLGLSMHGDSDVAAAMLEAGAVGYMTKGDPVDQLIEALRACMGEDRSRRRSELAPPAEE